MSTSGLIYPTQRGMLSGNPRDSAIAQMNNTNTKQAALASSVGGKKRKHRSTRRKKRYTTNRRTKRISHRKRSRRGGSKRRGGSNANANTIAVPQYQMLYTPQSGSNTDPNSQIQTNSQISTQGAANRVYDSQATIKGGKMRKCKRGGNNPNWNWGCYS